MYILALSMLPIEPDSCMKFVLLLDFSLSMISTYKQFIAFFRNKFCILPCTVRPSYL